MSTAASYSPELLQMHSAEWRPDSGVVFDFSNSKEPRKDIGNITKVELGNSSKRKYKEWGANNDLPTYREEILRGESLAAELLKTKRDMILGTGIMPYIEEVEDGVRSRRSQIMPPKIAKWIKDTGWEQELLKAVNNLIIQENVYPQFRVSQSDPDYYLQDVRIKDCKYIRAGKKINGEIRYYLYSSDWTQPNHEDHRPITISADETKSRFMLHFGDCLLCDGYYNHPAWYGAKYWIISSNKVPVFHNHNMDNGYVIRYHVKYDVSRFLKSSGYYKATDKDDKAKCLKAANKKRQEFIDKINDYLAGVKNTGRAVFTSQEYNKLSKQYDGVEIIPITTDTQDKTLLDYYEKALKAIISAFGVHPTLANVESQGKLSSGSEMRNAFNFWTSVKSQTYRRELLRIWDKIVSLNGWDKDFPLLKYGFEDLSMAKLDDDKSGMAPASTESQAPSA